MECKHSTNTIILNRVREVQCHNNESHKALEQQGHVCPLYITDTSICNPIGVAVSFLNTYKSASMKDNG
eukprot:3150304-Amphidinium_carterae.2